VRHTPGMSVRITIVTNFYLLGPTFQMSPLGTRAPCSAPASLWPQHWGNTMTRSTTAPPQDSLGFWFHCFSLPWFSCFPGFQIFPWDEGACSAPASLSAQHSPELSHWGNTHDPPQPLHHGLPGRHLAHYARGTRGRATIPTRLRMWCCLRLRPLRRVTCANASGKSEWPLFGSSAPLHPPPITPGSAPGTCPWHCPWHCPWLCPWPCPGTAPGPASAFASAAAAPALE